jgi:predicted transcriptional regulator
MKKPVKKTNLVKKAAFDASPVSRKEVDAIKAKLRKTDHKREALKIAQNELKAERKELQKKAQLKFLEALYQRSKTKK